MPDSAPEVHIIQVFTTVGSTAEASINLGVPNGLWELAYHGFARTAGTASQYQPLMGETTNPSGEHQRLNYAAAIAVGTVTRDQFDPPIPFAADAGGNLFYRPGFVGGSTDNSGTAVFRFRRVLGGKITQDAIT